MANDQRRIARRTLALFAFALGVRALHLFAMRDSPLFLLPLGDAASYDRWAQRIAGGEWMGTEVFYQTPLYPYLLGVTYWLFGHEPWIVRALQALFGAASCVLLARAGAHFFSERAGWCAGILLALYAPAVFFDGILQKASLDLLLMSALLWLVAVTQRRASGTRLFGAGLVLGAMILNRENAAALAPALIAWAFWIGWPYGRRHALASAALLALGLAALLVPVGLRNLHVGGAFLVTTSQMGSNFYIGNQRGADGGYTPMRAGRGDPLYEREDARRIAEDDLGRALGPAEVSRYWMERSWRDIRSAPGEWLRLLAWKWFLTWNRLEMVDVEALHTHARDSLPLRILGHALHFGVLVPLAVAGVWWTRRVGPRLWFLYATALTFAASVTIFYVFARYRYPLVPVAALFAGAGIDAFAALRGGVGGRARELAVAVALLAGAAILANWPVPQRYDDDAITWYNAGSTLLDAGRMEDAVALLERSRAADPGFPETYNNLGRVRLVQGDLRAARRTLERGMILAPNHAILHLNLAVVALRQGDADGARTLLERTIALDPLLAAAYGPLAELEMRRGDAATALAHLRRAVELQPDSAIAHADLALGWLVQGRLREAAEALRVALRLDPTLVPVRHRLAWILATTADLSVRNPVEALALAESLVRDSAGEQPDLLEVHAAALAANGAFAPAAETATRAIELASAGGDAALVLRIEAQRAAYLTGRALSAGTER